ncbi:MAG TPA: hypothetical protein VK461_12490, partial [Acidimicrobiales bacterium]|nr:hypothetical protein [Acidimicrobiales bacterium]
MSADRFAAARAVADAVLFEGYVLYPYRASARKNQIRWQFGVLVPPEQVFVEPSERASVRTDCVIDPGDAPRLHVKVRCLQVQHRTLERAEGRDWFAPVDELVVGDVRWVPWDEAVEHEIDLPPLMLLPLNPPLVFPFVLPGGQDVEELGDDAGIVGRAVRRREPVSGVVHVTTSWAPGPGALMAVRVVVENVSEWSEAGASRDDMVRRSLVAVHTLLAVDDGTFLSLIDQPEDAAEALASCANDGTWPVLVDEADTVVLSSPIILYDHPAVAPESPGDLYDATEIDEILALRVLTLTDDEKAEARGTDARAAAIVDRVDGLPPEVWERLHGVVRSIGPVELTSAPESVPWWDPGSDAAFDPSLDTVVVGGVEVGAGARVRLRPSRRADAHDLFLAGLVAVVAGVFNDVD